MPIIKGAKKALRASRRKRVFNIRRNDAMKDAIKSVKKAVAAKKPDDAKKLIPGLYAAIDKAAKRGIIKKNTASRKKARLTALVKKATK
jgi:small subunit ribosomal protein S20